MAFNPMKLFQLKGMWDEFSKNHPKFISFLSAIQARGIKEDTILEISIHYPNGENISSNMKFNQKDMELFQKFMETVKDIK